MAEILIEPSLKPRWFSASALRCKCCHVLVVDPTLVAALDELGELAQRPIHIVCGYRCPTENARRFKESAKRNDGKSRVAVHSQHSLGRAADITIAGCSLSQVAALAERVDRFRNGGLSRYEGEFVHLDVRGVRVRF